MQKILTPDRIHSVYRRTTLFCAHRSSSPEIIEILRRKLLFSFREYADLFCTFYLLNFSTNKSHNVLNLGNMWSLRESLIMQSSVVRACENRPVLWIIAFLASNAFTVGQWRHSTPGFRHVVEKRVSIVQPCSENESAAKWRPVCGKCTQGNWAHHLWRSS
jgi:hypothetical protein